MKRRHLFVAAALTALTIASAPPAVAASQRGTCSVSHSWSSIVVVLQLRATANCTESPVSLTVCIQRQVAAGVWLDEACGSGAGTGSASATASTVCTPGQLYRGRIAWGSGASVGTRITAPVTCAGLP